MREENPFPPRHQPVAAWHFRVGRAEEVSDVGNKWVYVHMRSFAFIVLVRTPFCMQ